MSHLPFAAETPPSSPAYPPVIPDLPSPVIPDPDRGSGSAGSDKGNSQMNRPLAAIAGALVIAFAVACGSAGDGSAPSAAPTADISSFPTPSVSRATRQPDPRPTSPAPTAQTPEDSEDSGSETADVPPISPEEIQELRERLGRGELSEEEAQEVFLRLREQFGGGQGATPDQEDSEAARPRVPSRTSTETPSPSRQNSPRSRPPWERTPTSA